MAQDRNSPTIEEKIDSRLLESKSLLSTLEHSFTEGEEAFNPTSMTEKKKEIFVRLEVTIMQQLEARWKLLQDQDAATKAIPDDNMSKATEMAKIAGKKRQMLLATSELCSIIPALSELNPNNEQNFKQLIDTFNKTVKTLNDDIQILANEAQKITYIEYGKTFSVYMGYTTAATKAVVTVVLACSHTLNMASKTAGTIFYPISASFTTLVKLFSAARRMTQLSIASKMNEEEALRLHQLNLKETKALLLKSVVLRTITFALSFASILAFAGVLATPAGWALVAGATLLDWVDDGIGAWQRAKAELKQKRDDQSIEALQVMVEKTRSDAIWGFVNVVSAVLIACGPIPVAGPLLGLGGLALLGIAAARNTYVAVKPHLEKYFSNKKVVPESEPEPEAEKKVEEIVEAILAHKATTRPAPALMHQKTFTEDTPAAQARPEHKHTASFLEGLSAKLRGNPRQAANDAVFFDSQERTQTPPPPSPHKKPPGQIGGA